MGEWVSSQGRFQAVGMCEEREGDKRAVVSLAVVGCGIVGGLRIG